MNKVVGRKHFGLSVVWVKSNVTHSRISNSNGKITSFKAFNLKLYTSDSTVNSNVMTNFFDSLEIPSIAHETPITQEEIVVAVSFAQSVKSPGHDGLRFL